MSNEIKMTTAPGALLSKAMMPGYKFRMVDAVQGEFAAINTPKLLTTMLSVDVNSHKSKSFLFDVEEMTAQLMNGKSFTEVGNKFTQDVASQLSFGIPSFGGAFSVNVADWNEKRIPNSTEMMDEEYVVAKQRMKVEAALDLLNELAIAQLITADTNYVAGGPGAVYNYSTVFTGSARPAATTLNFTTNADNRQKLREIIEDAIDVTTDALAKRMKSASGYIFVCGKNLFTAIYGLEANVDSPRELRTPEDFQSEGMPVISAGDFSNFRAFSHSSGAMIVKYTANILGTKLIGDDDGYLIPVGVENMFSIELAPAQTRDDAGKDAQALYMWTEADRRGIHFEFETNRLFMNRSPEAITAFTGVYA